MNNHLVDQLPQYVPSLQIFFSCNVCTDRQRNQEIGKPPIYPTAFASTLHQKYWYDVDALTASSSLCFGAPPPVVRQWNASSAATLQAALRKACAARLSTGLTAKLLATLLGHHRRDPSHTTSTQHSASSGISISSSFSLCDSSTKIDTIRQVTYQLLQGMKKQGTLSFFVNF